MRSVKRTETLAACGASPITVGGLICDTNWETSHRTHTATDRWHCSWNDVSMAPSLTDLSLSLSLQYTPLNRRLPPVSSITSSIPSNLLTSCLFAMNCRGFYEFPKCCLSSHFFLNARVQFSFLIVKILQDKSYTL